MTSDTTAISTSTATDEGSTGSGGFGSPMRVEVWSDIVCPWCFVGVRHLELALEELGAGDDIDVVLRSYQLAPGARTQSPEEHLAGLARKYGTSVGEMKARQAQIVAAGAQVGIDFRFDRAISGDTFDAHRLLHLALQRGVQSQLKHQLFRAYFTDGKPIADAATLREAAVAAGLDGTEVDTVLAGGAYASAVQADISTARELGITGVPFFLVDGRLALSGAQPPALMAKVLRRALDERRPVHITDALAGVDTDPHAACGPDGCSI